MIKEMLRWVSLFIENLWLRFRVGAVRTISAVENTVKIKKHASLQKVLSITPGGNHAWVESDVGRIRKPIWVIPPPLMQEFHEGRFVAEYQYAMPS